MKKNLKRILCASMTALMMAGTLMVADAATSYERNNTGNSCPYKGSIDISLGWRKTSVDGYGYMYTDHSVNYSKPTVTVNPYNSRKYKNKITWYAKYEDNGKLKDSNKCIVTVDNNKRWERDLSDGMKWTTWDSDVTYFRVDIVPHNGSTTENKIHEKYFIRRASTDITH